MSSTQYDPPFPNNRGSKSQEKEAEASPASPLKTEGMENSAKKEDVRTSEELTEKLKAINNRLMDDGEKLFFDTLPREILHITKRIEVRFPSSV